MDRDEIEVIEDLPYAWAVRCMRLGCPHVILVGKRNATAPEKRWCSLHPPIFIHPLTKKAT